MNPSLLKKKIAHLAPPNTLMLKPNQPGHVYVNPATGQEYSSVTTRLQVIANPQFAKWRMNRALEFVFKHAKDMPEGELYKQAALEPERIFTGAAEIGTQVHRAIEERLNGKPSQEFEDARVASAVKAFEDWVASVDFVPLATELTVWDDHFKIAGTIDAVGILNGELVIIDFKTAEQFHDEYFLQVAAYWKMLKETVGLSAKKCLIIKLSKDFAMASTEVVDQPRIWWKTFRKISQVFDEINLLRNFRKENRLMFQNKKKVIL